MLLFVVNCCLKPGSGDNTLTGKQPIMGQHQHGGGDNPGIKVLDPGQ